MQADVLDVQDLLLKCLNLAPWNSQSVIFIALTHYLVKTQTKVGYKNTLRYK